MIASLITWSLQNRVLVLALTLMLCFLGAHSLRNTPVDAIPDLSDVQVIIKTSYPGQAPKVVEDQITRPLSTALMAVPGAHTVRGFSFYGDSYVYVIFKDGTDVYWARSRVLEYLNQVSDQLPEGAQPKLGPDASGVGWVYIYALTDREGKHDLSELRSLQDWLLKYELQAVPGVAEVAPVGGMVKQYQVVIDPQKLLFHNIPLAHVRSAIARSNRETGVSVVELAEAEYMLRATGYISDAQSLRDVPLGLSDGGAPLFLRHIADVVESPAMRRGVAELDGEGEVVGGIVVMRYGENAERTIEAVKNKLIQLRKSLPESVAIVPVYDRSVLIKRAIHNLWRKVVEELALVALVVFAFLICVRSVLVAMITLPVGILASFLVMYVQGVNANIMSLGGIAIAIGAMIDGAIVMIENLHRKQQETSDKSHFQRVSESCLEVGPTLFFSLLIITVSFMPVFTLGAEEGRLFKPLAWTKTYAMAAAAILSVTLVPVLLFYLVRSNSPDGKRKTKNSGKLWRCILNSYRKSLRFCLAYKQWVLLGVLALSLAALIPLQHVRTEFMPPLDEGDLMYMPTTHPGISIGKARELLQQTDKIIRTVPEVAHVFGKVGRADTATDPAPLTMIESFIQLKPRSLWRDSVTTETIIAELEEKVKFPGLTNAWVMPIKTRIDMLATGMKTPLGIKLAGADIAELQNLGERLESLLTNLPGTTSVYAERSAGGRYLTIDVNRVSAAQYGLTIADIHEWLKMSVAGAEVSESVEGAERYPISIRFPDRYRDTPERLNDLPIITPQGAHIRLGDVAQLSIGIDAPMYKSEGARINTWIYLDIGDTDISDYVMQAEALITEKIEWPSGYTMRWAGQYEAIQRVKDSLAFVIPLTLCSIAILLFLNFRRFSDVFIFLLSLPFALIGGLVLILLLDYKMSVAVAVGFIALAGLAVETGAIMLQVLRSKVSHRCTEGLAGQVEEFASQRLRPVLMTAIATIAGLMPVMFGHEPGSEVMSRIAAPVIGGLVTSIVLTLFVIPLLFQIVKSQESE